MKIIIIAFVLMISGCKGQSNLSANSENLIGRESEKMKIENVQFSDPKMKTELTIDEQDLLNKALETIAVPEDFMLESVTHGNHDDRSITVFRYTKDGEKNEGGEHFSITVGDKDHKLIGFTFMDQRFDVNHGIIKEEEAERIAIEFLNHVDPELMKNGKWLWTGRHDETINIDGKDYTISGMKYKCYIESKDVYHWVIVGHDGQIITFEQDIVWSNGMSKRISEQWLHDRWRAEKNNF